MSHFLTPNPTFFNVLSHFFALIGVFFTLGGPHLPLISLPFHPSGALSTHTLSRSSPPLLYLSIALEPYPISSPLSPYLSIPPSLPHPVSSPLSPSYPVSSPPSFSLIPPPSLLFHPSLSLCHVSSSSSHHASLHFLLDWMMIATMHYQ